METSNTFDPSSFCSHSSTRLRHDSIQTFRCPGCGLENPNYVTSSPAQRIVIADDESAIRTMSALPTLRSCPPSPSSPRSSQSIPRPLTPDTSRQADIALTAISSISMASLNQAKLLTRVSIIIRVIHAYNQNATIWRPEKPLGWVINLDNQSMNYDDFIQTSLDVLRNRMKRPSDLQWLNPQAAGDWDIVLLREPNAQLVFVVPWPKSEVLSSMLSNAHMLDPSSGPKELSELVLCFRPAAPARSASPISQTSPGRSKRSCVDHYPRSYKTKSLEIEKAARKQTRR